MLNQTLISGIATKDFITCCFDAVFVYLEFTSILALLRDRVVLGYDYRLKALGIFWNLWSTFIIYAEAMLFTAQIFNFILLIENITWCSLLLWFRHKASSRNHASATY